jgi:hypothetical protein
MFLGNFHSGHSRRYLQILSIRRYLKARNVYAWNRYIIVWYYNLLTLANPFTYHPIDHRIGKANITGAFERSRQVNAFTISASQRSSAFVNICALESIALKSFIADTLINMIVYETKRVTALSSILNIWIALIYLEWPICINTIGMFVAVSLICQTFVYVSAFFAITSESRTTFAIIWSL